MGTFRIDVNIENILNRSRLVTVFQMLVDTGSEMTWVPSAMLESIGVERTPKVRTFTMANGAIITRGIGYALIRSGEYETVD
ncbi:MAG: retroviral-like aspartic protease family protein, partial [Planctomycetota bacterium]|nr:retroviral-like aspartic protease family protein [Planctomycetota bacterium]